MSLPSNETMSLRSGEQTRRQNVNGTMYGRALGTDVSLFAPSKNHTPVTVANLLNSGKRVSPSSILSMDYAVWQGDVEAFLDGLPKKPLFDLVVTSPPYNLGKVYETQMHLRKYLLWQSRIIGKLVPRLKKGGSLCWQVGNYVENNEIFPLDVEFAPIFRKRKLQLRNRIIWQFGHGLHTHKRFSGRYEVVMWYTRTDSIDQAYTFNLDPVRVPAKYPGKKHFKGPNLGQFSGNPLGKNPEDVWNIPNVKSNHVEKTDHPCQFPVGLIERLVLALTNADDLVFDPFAGVASAGVAAALHGRRFWGCELVAGYAEIGKKRIDDALNGSARYRPHDKAVYDHTKSNLSRAPEGFRQR